MDTVPAATPWLTKSCRLPGAALAPGAGILMPAENAITPCVSLLPQVAKAHENLCCRNEFDSVK